MNKKIYKHAKQRLNVSRLVKNKTLTDSQFSKLNLVLFILIFGAIGAYILYKSFAATPGIQTLADAPVPNAGIYAVNAAGNPALDASKPWVEGGQIKLIWGSVETNWNPATQRGSFNWDTTLKPLLDTYMNNPAPNGGPKPTTIQINSSNKPSWMRNYIAMCTEPSSDVKGWDYPQFWDPLFLTMQQDMLTSLANWLASHPQYQSTILGIRTSPNAHGTEHANPGPQKDGSGNDMCTPATNGQIVSQQYSSTVASTFYQNIMQAYHDILSPVVTPIYRAQLYTYNIAPITNPSSPWNWLNVNTGWIFSTGSAAEPQGPSYQNLDQLAKDWAGTGKTIGYWEPYKDSTAFTNPVSENYWRLLLDLYKGVSMVAVYGTDLDRGDSTMPGYNPEYKAAFDFVNKYAAYPTQADISPGSWCALSPAVGISTGNYCKFMTQLNPGTTSTALGDGQTPIGPASQRFSRYARSTLNTSTAMSFQLDSTFRSSLASFSSCTLNVTYLNSGTTNFTIKYGTGAGDSNTVTKTNNGNWTQKSLPISCSKLQGGLGSGSDIQLTASGANTTFHMVELQVDRSTPSDTQAPTMPTNLHSTGVTSTSVSLAWTASTDNVGVTGYRVYRNGGGTPVATVTSTSYTDTGLTPSTLYSYTVDAIDAAGNASAKTGSINATTSAPADTQAPSIPGNPHSTGSTSTTISIDWNASTDNVGVVGYKIYRNGSSTALASVPSPGFSDSGLTPSTNYTYRITAYDAAGNESATSTVVSVTTQASPGDTQAPSIPNGLSSPSHTDTTVTLTWNASTDNSGGTGVGGYNIYRNGGLLDSTTDTNYTDDNGGVGLDSSTKYTYRVSAFDKATPRNESPPSTSIDVTTDPTPVPTITFSASPTTINSGDSSTLTWDSTDTTLCIASGAWSGQKLASGSATVGPLSTTSTYKLDCSGPGGSASASVTITVNPTPIIYKVGDLNHDGYVNVFDLSILLSHYGQSAIPTQGDITGDGKVDIYDLSSLLTHYGK
jgi:chitodextrinase